LVAKTLLELLEKLAKDELEKELEFELEDIELLLSDKELLDTNELEDKIELWVELEADDLEDSDFGKTAISILLLGCVGLEAREEVVLVVSTVFLAKLWLSI
jgi:hypothetical protein